MWVQSGAILAVGVFFTVLEKGLALKCFRCSSVNDRNCEDPFNVTRILSLPDKAQRDFYNTECTGDSTITMSQLKNVCLKKVSVNAANQKQEITRECHMVSIQHKLGTCPDTLESKSLQFCSTCDYDGCNSAPRIQVILTGVVPAVLMVLMYY